MSLYSRYILRNGVAPFVAGTLTTIFLFLMQFLIKNLDKLVGKGIDNFVIGEFILLNIAWMVILSVPLGVLFSSLMTFGNMSDNSEITILKSSGCSLLKMMRPMLMASIILTVLLFYYDSQIVPDTNHAAKLLMFDINKTKTTFSIEKGQFSNSIDGFTILARDIDTSTNTLLNTTIYDNRLISGERIINAERGKIVFSADMSTLEFTLDNGQIYENSSRNNKKERLLYFKKYILSTAASGFGFEKSEEGYISRGDREMKIADMQAIVDKNSENIRTTKQTLNQRKNEYIAYLLEGKTNAEEIDKGKTEPSNIVNNPIFIDSDYSAQRMVRGRPSANAGLLNFESQMQMEQSRINFAEENSNGYKVEIYKKYAIPFACIVFVLIGCPLGIITKRGNFGVSASLTLLGYIVYWACLIMGEKLADRGMMHPAIGMWMGNIIMGLLGIFLTFKANNETLSFSPTYFSKLKLFFTRNKIR